MVMPSRENAKACRNRNFVRHTFSLSNLFGDPFAISSISISILSWVIAMGGSIASASNNEVFPRFTWWGLAYQIMIIFMMIVLYCYDVVDYYKLFLTGASAVSFIYSTNSATNLVYSAGAEKAAASAGVILLSIVNLIWIFYFGSDNASPTNRWVDSFSLRGIRPSAYEDALIRSIHRRSTMNGVNRNVRNSTINRLYSSTDNNNLLNSESKDSTGGGKLHHYVSSNALTGFENTANFNGPPNNTSYPENPTFSPAPEQEINTFITDSSNANTDTTMGDTLGLYSEFGEDTFPYTAKALYSYQADDADGYEISFEQGEILKVSDIEGRWWKSRRENGETGIIPSNYVKLIQSVD